MMHCSSYDSVFFYNIAKETVGSRRIQLNLTLLNVVSEETESVKKYKELGISERNKIAYQRKVVIQISRFLFF